jgi:hypothetical protein
MSAPLVQVTLFDALSKAGPATKKTTSRKRPLALVNGGKPFFCLFLFKLRRISPHVPLGVIFTRHRVHKLINLVFTVGTVDLSQKLKSATPEVRFSALRSLPSGVVTGASPHHRLSKLCACALFKCV